MSDKINQITKLINGHRLEEAIPIMEELIIETNIQTNTLIKLADLYRRTALETSDPETKGKLAENALFALKRATKQEPQNALAWSRLGHFYFYYLDKYDDAIDAFSHAYTFFQKNWQLNTALGQAHLAKNTLVDLEKAIQYFKKAVELASDQFDPYYFGAQAIKIYNQKAVDMDTEFCPNLDSALELMDQARELFPKEFTQSKEFDHLKKDALTLYSKYLEHHDSDAEAWYHLGLMQYLDGAYDEAILCFTNSTDLDPNTVEAWFYLGLSVYYGPQDFARALSLLKKCIEKSPRFVDAYIYMGDIAFDLKQWNDATDAYKKALEIEPTNGLAKEGIGMVEKYMMISPGLKNIVPDKNTIPLDASSADGEQIKSQIPITIRLDSHYTSEQLWNQYPNNGLADRSLLDVFIDQLQDHLPQVFRELTKTLPIQELRIPIEICFGNAQPLKGSLQSVETQEQLPLETETFEISENSSIEQSEIPFSEEKAAEDLPNLYTIKERRPTFVKKEESSFNSVIRHRETPLRAFTLDENSSSDWNITSEKRITQLRKEIMEKHFDSETAVESSEPQAEDIRLKMKESQNQTKIEEE